MAEERQLSQQKSASYVDLSIANAIVLAEDTNNCNIREGVVISRLSPQISAKVIQPFSIQLFLSEEGYMAVSTLCNICELEKTRGDAVRSYLCSLVGELVWLQKHEKSLSRPLQEELNRISNYIQIVASRALA